MNVEIVTNRKALSTVRNKKKELKDLDNHAWQNDSETSTNVVDALDSVNELESTLDQSKESMYKLSLCGACDGSRLGRTETPLQ